MKVTNYRYEVEEVPEVFKIKMSVDVSFSNLLVDFPILDKLSSVFDKQMVRSDTSIFIDKNNGSVLVRNPNKTMILLADNKRLDVSFDKLGFLFEDDGKLFDFKTLTRNQKHNIFGSVISFMENFDDINECLPIEASKTFIFLQMGILNMRDVTIVHETDDVILYLNSFRKLNLEKLKLNVADATTYEIVGSIDASLNKKGEDNFSFYGNVSYKTNEGYQNLGYATASLRALIEYINTLSDEYNKELYIASLVDDLAYQMVALKNGANIYYDGDVPDGESLATLNKIRQIKIYKIANK